MLNNQKRPYYKTKINNCIACLGACFNHINLYVFVCLFFMLTFDISCKSTVNGNGGPCSPLPSPRQNSVKEIGISTVFPLYGRELFPVAGYPLVHTMLDVIN